MHSLVLWRMVVPIITYDVEIVNASLFQKTLKIMPTAVMSDARCYHYTLTLE